jgi:hypothetical protein
MRRCSSACSAPAGSGRPGRCPPAGGVTSAASAAPWPRPEASTPPPALPRPASRPRAAREPATWAVRARPEQGPRQARPGERANESRGGPRLSGVTRPRFLSRTHSRAWGCHRGWTSDVGHRGGSEQAAGLGLGELLPPAPPARPEALVCRTHAGAGAARRRAAGRCAAAAPAPPRRCAATAGQPQAVVAAAAACSWRREAAACHAGHGAGGGESEEGAPRTGESRRWESWDVSHSFPWTPLPAACVVSERRSASVSSRRRHGRRWSARQRWRGATSSRCAP